MAVRPDDLVPASRRAWGLSALGEESPAHAEPPRRHGGGTCAPRPAPSGSGSGLAGPGWPMREHARWEGPSRPTSDERPRPTAASPLGAAEPLLRDLLSSLLGRVGPTDEELHLLQELAIASQTQRVEEEISVTPAMTWLLPLLGEAVERRRTSPPEGTSVARPAGTRPTDGHAPDLRVRHLEEELARQRRLGALDPLTGLPNRRGLEEWLQANLARPAGELGPFSLLIFDIDHFKRINDTWGHLAGDHVLVAVGARLQEAIRRQDCLCRYGGEEFCAILPDTALATAHKVAQRTLAAIREAPVLVQEGETSWEIGVTLSAGGAEATPGEDFANTFLRADGALYSAKHEGRDGVRTAPAPQR